MLPLGPWVRGALLLNLPSLFLAWLAHASLAMPRDGSSHEAVAAALLLYSYLAFTPVPMSVLRPGPPVEPSQTERDPYGTTQN